ncbi:MAG: glycosyltransferase family protein [Thermodesulfobacteriota bacterium]
MHVLCLGSDNLAPALRAQGCRVSLAGPQAEADLVCPARDPDWRDIEAAAQAKGLVFDAVLVTDDIGRRTLPTGLSAAGPVTAFWALDAPLNRFWHFAYAGLFDLALFDQPTEAAAMAATHPASHWLPVAVDPQRYQSDARPQSRAGACFVGVVDAGVRPKRSALLAKAAKITSLAVRGGRQDQWFATADAARLYREHQVVLNENLFAGLTTRPLEVMAAGGCLLSEAAPGTMDRHFSDLEHLAYFDPDSFEQKLEQLLGDHRLRLRLAEQGRAAVRAGHSFRHRARQLLDHIVEMSKRPPEERPRARGGEALRREGEALLLAGLRWPGPAGDPRLGRALGRLAAAARDGADPLAASRGYGLAALNLGQGRPALEHLARAAQAGGEIDRLAWGLAAWQLGRSDLARQVFRGLPGLAGQPGEAGFHLEAAEILRRSGQGLCPGFNRLGLPQAWWTALEHLLEASRLRPADPVAWERLGDLLLAQAAPNQAHDCYLRARSLAPSPELAAKLARAAREGYLA